ncbi:pyridoxine 5'-phosphate synthase [Marinicella gelatinilytica]|uniref:pyridoxine 5'-phosphate synthase n=1 Tax=Marinicella gelatinilytica TaxID=2996017 RepID=UPI002260D762|nr:pyridoxine 5'-phosphate synthase [Marinicella gelatinilytica]MCX7543985.1 pyridoxine 5'-phosphate synthase [Marinicella gelatinilytica]
MTALSVNLNKIALLRNSRGRDYPQVVAYGRHLIDLGVQGLTVHPRQDQRHTKDQDVHDLRELVGAFSGVELNVEGYPDERFLQLILATRPHQCTLVPDSPNQLTSDHGWDLHQHFDRIQTLAEQLQSIGVRSSIFLDPDCQQVELAAKTGVDRIELYTEAYANAYADGDYDDIWAQYFEAAQLATSLGLGVNAGHDLDLNNLTEFLTIPHILEVSIGHALTVESLYQGVDIVVKQYLQICANS